MNKTEQFIAEYQIAKEIWEASNSSIEELHAIAENYRARLPNLKISAEYFANALQSISSVHSVRWRTKDVQHLIRKIVRKRAEKVEKYLSISRENYQEVVGDLIGVRAIHLFKDDLIEIDREVRLRWEIRETPTIYIREGDQNCPSIEQPYNQKVHKAGYRSAHYIIESKPTKETVVAELQVRTIFEEGWSEIDHTLRYPDHSDDRDLQSVLTLFNRIAGSADEIASFTLRIKKSIETTQETLKTYRVEAEQYKNERDTSYQKIENLFQELNSHKSKGDEQQKLIEKLREELLYLRDRDSAIESISQGKKMQTETQSEVAKALALLAGLAFLTSK